MIIDFNVDKRKEKVDGEFSFRVFVIGRMAMTFRKSGVTVKLGRPNNQFGIGHI